MSGERDGWRKQKMGFPVGDVRSGGNGFDHGKLFSNKDGDGPLARRIALLIREVFLLADWTNVHWFGKPSIRKAVPLHGLRKHRKTKSQWLVIHIANDIDELMVPADRLTVAPAKHERQ